MLYVSKWNTLIRNVGINACRRRQSSYVRRAWHITSKIWQHSVNITAAWSYQDRNSQKIRQLEFDISYLWASRNQFKKSQAKELYVL
jgi:hypothetical protein